MTIFLFCHFFADIIDCNVYSLRVGITLKGVTITVFIMGYLC